MNDKTLLDPKDAARRLDVSTSTLRRYSSQYAHLMSEHAATKGRKRKYTLEDIAVLAKVRDYSRQHRAQHEIETLLTTKMDLEEVKEAQAGIDDYFPYVYEQFDYIRSTISRVDNDTNAQIAELRAEIEQLKKRRWWKFWE